MAILNEEFLRCSCGGADFRKEEIVTLPLKVKKRYGLERANELPILDKTVIYVCTSCLQQLDK